MPWSRTDKAIKILLRTSIPREDCFLPAAYLALIEFLRLSQNWQAIRAKVAPAQAITALAEQKPSLKDGLLQEAGCFDKNHWNAVYNSA